MQLERSKSTMSVFRRFRGLRGESWLRCRHRVCSYGTRPAEAISGLVRATFTPLTHSTSVDASPRSNLPFTEALTPYAPLRPPGVTDGFRFCGKEVDWLLMELFLHLTGHGNESLFERH